MRSRLREEMEEKSALEQKVSALVAQLDDAKRSLQDTSFALHKATLVNSQMKSKKEERDVELLESNQYMQRRIHDLECQLHEMRARALESMSNKYDSNNSAKSDFSDVSVESLRNELTAARAQIAELMHANHHLAEFQPLHMEASQSQFVKDKSMYFYGSSSHSTDDGECKESVSETHVRLKQQKAQARTIIMDWYHKFVRENGREPTKAERDVCVGVDYRLYRRVSGCCFCALCLLMNACRLPRRSRTSNRGGIWFKCGHVLVSPLFFSAIIFVSVFRTVFAALLMLCLSYVCR